MSYTCILTLNCGDVLHVYINTELLLSYTCKLTLNCSEVLHVYINTELR
jgi:hypothetical protein